MSLPCPCCSGKAYQSCCAPYLDQQALAPTPEKLMRSRYTAYVRHNVEYLVNTWHPDCQPEHLIPSLQHSFSGTEWLGLQIIE
ncbi:MAG: hypothetical protein XXXJIFNMEKO3_01537 [Candidatus Erwinia impunctatus]